MNYKPGDAFEAYFTTRAAAGGAVNADSLPSAVFKRNGATDAAVTVTIANVGTGIYKATCTIPSSGYAAGDRVSVIVTGTVGGVTESFVLGTWVLDSKRLADLNDLAAGAAMTLTGAYDAAKNAAAPGAAMTLTSAYDAAKTAAAAGAQMTLTSAYDAAKTAAPAGAAMTLTAGAIDAVALKVEQRFGDEMDGQAIIQAFVNKIAAANPTLGELSLAGIATAVRNNLSDLLDVAVSTRLAAGGYTVPPTAAANAAAVRANLLAELARLDVPVSSIAPISAEDLAEAVDGILSTNHGAGSWLAVAGGATSAELEGAKTVAAMFLTMLEANGSDFRFTEPALVNAPASTGGGGGGSGFTSQERTKIVTAAERINLTPGTGPVVVINASSNPDVCVAFGTIFSGSGEPVAGVEVKAVLQSVIAGKLVLGDVLQFVTGENGVFQAPLIKGAKYRLEIPRCGFADDIPVPADSVTLNIGAFVTA